MYKYKLIFINFMVKKHLQLIMTSISVNVSSVTNFLTISDPKIHQKNLNLKEKIDKQITEIKKNDSMLKWIVSENVYSGIGIDLASLYPKECKSSTISLSLWMKICANYIDIIEQFAKEEYKSTKFYINDPGFHTYIFPLCLPNMKILPEEFKDIAWITIREVEKILIPLFNDDILFHVAGCLSLGGIICNTKTSNNWNVYSNITLYPKTD